MKSPTISYRCRTFILILSVFFSATVLAADLPETFRISRIDIEGAHFLKKKEIRSVLLVHPPAPWRIWSKHPVASVEDLDDETQHISQFYQSKGFYHAVVHYKVKIIGKKNAPSPSVRVTYQIDEGAPVIVADIVIDPEGATLPSGLDDLLKSLPLKKGMRFEEKAYRESKELILKRLGGIGYPQAEVNGKALIYPSENKAAVTFSIVPGKLCYFGVTRVTGGASIVNGKILTRSRTYHPGEVYDISKVEQSQRNLYNLDVLKAAVIQPGEPDPETGRVPMTLELKSKKKRSIKLGVGYGDEDGVRLRAGYTYRNPWGWAGKFTFEAKRTDLLKKASLGYNQPYFLDARNVLQTEAGVLQEFYDSYESLKFFGTARFTRGFEHHLNLSVAYLPEYSELKDLNLVDPTEIEAFRKDHSFFVSSVFFQLIRNTAGSDPSPKKGSTVTASVEVASTLLGSGLTYVKPSVEFKKYIELPLGIVWAGRIRYESISDPEKNGDIPILKRLFLGGANTVRGYSFQKLGPLDATGNPIGGRSSLLANIEFRHPIIGILSGVLFLDGGMLDQDQYSFDRHELRWSTGAGIRVKTPVGPLRLDFGYKLNPSALPENEGYPAVKSDRWRLHLNIGQAF